MSSGLTELLLWLLVQRQVNTKASQFAKYHEMGNIVGDLETFPLNPEVPIHQLAGEEEQKRQESSFKDGISPE